MSIFGKALNAASFGLQVGAIVFVMKSFAFAQNYIPSESMVPTLEVGDRLLTDKTAYGWSRHSLIADPGLAFPGSNGRIWGSLPERGDVVTFIHPINGETMIKRVIGLPGDRVALTNGRLIINGEMVERRKTGQYSYRQHAAGPVTVTLYDELLPEGVVHKIIEQGDNGWGDHMAETKVPDGMLFMMGDNRDNSLDSRFRQMGFVPVENLTGKARLITYSLHECSAEQGLACAPRRYFSAIQ